MKGKKKFSDQELLEYIAEYKQGSGGLAPTNQEIMRALGLQSKNTIWARLNKLAAEGRIRLPQINGQRMPRAIQLPGEWWALPISTQKDPPTRGQWVLFFHAGQWQLGKYTTDLSEPAFVLPSMDGYVYYKNASHWMPLPPMPHLGDPVAEGEGNGGGRE